MPQKRLHEADVGSSFEHRRGRRMPERMARYRLADPGLPDDPPNTVREALGPERLPEPREEERLLRRPSADPWNSGLP